MVYPPESQRFIHPRLPPLKLLPLSLSLHPSKRRCQSLGHHFIHIQPLAAPPCTIATCPSHDPSRTHSFPAFFATRRALGLRQLREKRVERLDFAQVNLDAGNGRFEQGRHCGGPPTTECEKLYHLNNARRWQLCCSTTERGKRRLLTLFIVTARWCCFSSRCGSKVQDTSAQECTPTNGTTSPTRITTALHGQGKWWGTVYGVC